MKWLLLMTLLTVQLLWFEKALQTQQLNERQLVMLKKQTNTKRNNNLAYSINL